MSKHGLEVTGVGRGGAVPDVMVLDAGVEVVAQDPGSAYQRATEALTGLREAALAALKAPVDAFFDGVMVNAEDAALRANRQALLSRLHQAMNRVADLSRLAA